MQRRTFLRNSAGALTGLVLASRPSLAAEAEVTIREEVSGPEISPHLYGQFIEHLGGVIYDGIWVGRDSKIANVDGIRRSFVDAMKRINVPNFRWPGGCFADGYHWRDGIGDPPKRPRTYNYWQASMPAGYDHTETNRFGIHEFMRLCRLTGAEPYLAANMASGSPEEFHDWVLYCNAPAGTASRAEERVANGDRAPFGVQWWGVGNESWGCGGDMSPQEYSMLYRRFATQFPAYAPKPYLVAVGPRGHSKDRDLGWTRGFWEAMKDGHRTPVDGLSVHYYTDFRKSPEKVATFDEHGWYDVIREGARIQRVIEQHWELMGRYDAEHHTKLVIDEWGVWYKPGEEIAPNYLLSQPVTLRDALHTAITFDVFHKHAEKIAMTNVAQTINCIHSLFLAKGDRFIRTPVYSVFELYRDHMHGRRAAVQLRCDDLRIPTTEGGTARMPGLSAAASFRDKMATVTISNPSFNNSVSTRVRLDNGNVLEARAQILTHAEAMARNSFADPEQVRLQPFAVKAENSGVNLTIPAHSVVALQLRRS